MKPRDIFILVIVYAIGCLTAAIWLQRDMIRKESKKFLRVWRVKPGKAKIFYPWGMQPDKSAIEERTWPPKNPGGRPANDTMDIEAIAMINQGRSVTEAWEELAPKHYPAVVLSDPVLWQGEYENFRKRVNRKLKDKNDLP